MKLKTFLKNNLFILLILVVLVFSVFVPAPGMFVKEQGLTSYLTFIAMFASGLGLSVTHIKDGFRDFKSIIYGFSSIYIIFPAITFAAMIILGIRGGDVYVGSMILAAQSTTLASAVVLTATANSNVPLALIITIVNNMAAVFMTPLVLKIALAGQNISFDVGPMIFKLLLVLVLPVVLALVIRKIFCNFVDKIAPYRKAVSQFVVLVIVLSGTASASQEISNNVAKAALILLLVAALHATMLFITTLYLKITKTKQYSKAAVLLTSTQKTLPAGLLVWESYFPTYALAPLVLVLHHMAQLVIDSFVVNRLLKTNRRNKDDKQE